MFNAYFVYSIQDIVREMSVNNVQYSVTEKVATVQQMWYTFKKVEMMELRKTVQNLPNRATTENGITSTLLKTSFDIIGNQFTDVINCSLQQGVFPELWKTSVVVLVPVPKVHGSKQCVDFRPIKVLPTYEKNVRIKGEESVNEVLRGK